MSVSRSWLIVPEENIVINSTNDTIAINAGGVSFTISAENKTYLSYLDLFKEFRAKFAERESEFSFVYSILVGEAKGNNPKKFFVFFLFDVVGTVSGNFISSLGGLESTDFGNIFGELRPVN